MAKAAVFLDRDDTLIENIPYLGDPSKVRLMPGAAEACQKLRQAGYFLFVVSNQSGVGRGLITKEQVRSVDLKMESLIGAAGTISGYYHCFATPGDPYDERRKPSPAMLQEAAHEHVLDLARSFMIGNRLSDIQAGLQAGCSAILLDLCVPMEEKAEAARTASFVAKDWNSAVEWIQRRHKS
ncbi:MAG: HAD family hydrolase [Verrucomicrobia bacterium]|nr:HAD family hydrolase [Verrucomicrobiota bacterium]NDA26013.1 HAD family hydrolase [Verrucomicrobiota bacterium]NDD56715.1 HAD family hydrolase [Verrucomicrobiota bacterium]NDD81659.1 HAD family hydrolase [Verrucomicrobiota bacterium]